MKLTLDADVLGRALRRAGGVVERRNTIPILSNIRIEALNDNKASLRTTDLDIEISEVIEADVEVLGAITVNAHMLADIVKKFPAGAEVSMELKDSVLSLKSGRSRFTLQTLPASDYPDLVVGDFPTKFTLPAKILADVIHQVEFAISTEETRYYLNGVYFHPMKLGNRQVVRAVSTDGHRLAQTQITAPEGADKFAGIIIPRKAIAQIERLLEGTEAEVSVELSETKIRFSLGDIILSSKLIDGTFPDYARVVPQGNDKLLKLESEAFKAAVDRVQTISTERGRAVKMSMSSGKLTVSASNPDSGSATEELGVEYESDDMEIGFNSRYLLDLAQHVKGTVEFHLAEPGSPTLIRTEGELDTLFVLMPMRV